VDGVIQSIFKGHKRIQQHVGTPKRRPVTVVDRALGERIKYRREYLGLSQAEVAARMNKHTDRAVGHWESGYARISAVDLMQLARVLGCPVGYLTGEEAYNLTDQDREWLGHLGRTLGMLPAGRARDLYKQKLREDVEREAEFLRRLVDADASRT
jgi:transcriptional regulator with XRE-family HTH domain